MSFFTQELIVDFVASGTPRLIKRQVLGRLRFLATWTRWIGDFTRTLGIIMDDALHSWCTQDQGHLVIMVVLQPNRGDAMLLRPLEVEALLTISIEGQNRAMKKVASYRWILAQARVVAGIWMHLKSMGPGKGTSIRTRVSNVLAE